MGERDDKTRSHKKSTHPSSPPSGSASKTQQPSEKEFSLEADTELRIEVAEGDRKAAVTVELTAGLAEVFGTELVRKKRYVMPAACKAAVFTWHGAHVRVTGHVDVAYVARETPMVMYLNAHAVLEQMRRKASDQQPQQRGPVCMVVGPTDVGKSTLCRLLANYAVRAGRRPLLVELDAGQGCLSVPGTVSAMVVERTASVEEGFAQTAPVVYHTGSASAADNSSCYRLLLSRLAETVISRMRDDSCVGVSGAVINTCGWVKGDGYRMLMHAAAAFEVDVVLVLDHERLYNELVRDLPNFVEVVYMPKSGGVAERSSVQRSEAREHRVRAYFYGASNLLHPHSVSLGFDDVNIHKIGAPKIPESALPLGMKMDDCDTKLVPVTPTSSLLHHLLAVSLAAQDADDHEVVTSGVAGYVCVTAVDTDKRQLTLLSPQPLPLPSSTLLYSDVQYMDSH